MATFFGEILPVISRAVDDDEDEEDLPQLASATVIRWSPKAREEMEKSPNQCLKCHTLIISIGQAATGFAQIYLMNQETERLGVICSGLQDRDVNTLTQESATDKACFIHRLKQSPEVILVMCNTLVIPEQAHSWVEQLFSKIHLDNLYVAVLGSSPVSEFKSEVSQGDLPVPFMRALRTSHFKGSPVCPFLEQPNTIAGLPAQILSYCQVHQVAAMLYTAYTESMFLDPDVVKMYRSTLTTTPFKDMVKENPKAAEILNKMIEIEAEQNNIYI